ncbi:FAD-binding oxidoreductase [Streptomyces cacaoi]|uniref:4-cresol dehydrogenase n=1 Tax=Streptomyces cacaoi TaxID=1898 RepID=A0A4Y3QW92_STRCI|nr:FAD-dependent oxidoreductase [Streptomyces cacaoi]NNG85035.1 FAD-dependent oxidoreductase [Streptomyces cacaoi]GEB49686.1 4-cresol dehydrogenase [Streptomyces cacaoi]
MREAALDVWRALIGAEHVLAGPAAPAAAGGCTFAGAPAPEAVLLPGTDEEAAACLRAAHTRRIRVHPVSTGRNWGYGSGCPPEAGAVVLRLARLDSVLDFDDERGLVRVQPGVTFGRLAAFLRAHGGRWWPPSVGAGPDVSVVGNVLQRGLGQGPYRELGSHVEALTGLCPDGTAFGAATGRPGPDPAGLLFQGGPAVVTSLTLRLCAAPALRQRVTFRVPDAAALPEVIEGAREMLRHGGGLAADVLDRARVASQRPPGATGEELPELLTGAWTGGAELWAPDEDALSSLRRRALAWAAAHGDRWHMTPPRTGAPAPEDGDADPYAGLACAYRPRPHAWHTARSAGTAPDPDRDGCGVLWYAPALPMRGADVARVVGAVDRICAEEGQEAGITLRLGPRELYCVTGLFWDRDEAGADARGARCHARLVEEGARIGVFPYRPVLGGWPEEAVDTGTRQVLARVRAALDPHAVLGRPPG